MDAENIDIETPMVTLSDLAGRLLPCYLEHSLEVNNTQYVVLLPVDSPVEIFVWPLDEDADEPIPVESSEAIASEMFDLAKAVLAEKNLTLQRTAVTLTVAGELPELNLAEEELDPETEELMLLASFYYKKQEYDVYAPLDPLLLIAKMNEAGSPELLSPEELSSIEPLLPEIEEQLFKTLSGSE
ncbi:MAG: DUF3727 domain-containing protein [Hormoscilla sp. GM7CHS1pb]|nr:DUF3727 domain-containing protein [Hormoscilla sp. GM7CHS1pb]